VGKRKNYSVLINRDLYNSKTEIWNLETLPKEIFEETRILRLNIFIEKNSLYPREKKQK